jgi:ABC-type bacteriocin/lantibiotic exporter with double-glycine peptidase domain
LSGERGFSGLLAKTLPPVGGNPTGRMPEGLYGYVMAVSRVQQLPLCLLTFLVFPLTLAPLELQRRIVNEAIGGRQLELLFWLGGIYLAVAVTQGALKYLRNVYLERVGQGVARRLRRRIAGSQSIDAKMPEGTRRTLMAVEAEDVGGFVAESLAFPLLQAGIVLSIAGYMLIVDPVVAVVALGFFVPSIILVAVVQPRLNRLTGKKTRTQRWLGEVVLEDHRTDVESHALPRRIDRLIEHLYGLKIRIARLKYLTKVVTNLLGHLGPLSILVIGGWLVIRGDSTLGTIVAFVSGYDKMTEPARELLNFYRRLSMMRVQYGLVRDAANGGGQQA